MLVSSLLVTATSMSASSAPACRSTVGNDAWPCTVRISRRSPRSRRRSPSVSTTVMSLASPERCSASVPPTWPAPRIMIFTWVLLQNRLFCADQPPLRGGIFAELGIIETVMTVDLRQQLPAVGLRQPERPFNGEFAGVGGAGQKGADVVAVLLRQGRAGGIQQDAAPCQGRPEGVEHLALQLRQCRDVVGLTGQFDVRMPADHARGRTGCIQ